MLKRKSKKSQRKSKKKPSSEIVSLSKKEIAMQKRRAARNRQELISFSARILAAAIAIAGILAIISTAKIAIMASIGLICMAFSYKYPYLGLWAFLIYLPFAGTVSYTLGGSEPGPVFQLAKDAFYIPALISLFLYCFKKNQPILIPKKLIPSLAVLVGIVLINFLFVNAIQQINPPGGDKPIFIGILGIKILLGYIPLIFCSYYLIRGKKELLFLTRLLVILSLICSAMGLMQFIWLKLGFCTGTVGSGKILFKASTDFRCLFGGSLLFNEEHGTIRLPGTFASPWHWAWFLISSAFYNFAAAFNDPSFLWRMISLSSLALVFILAVICGQRIAMVLVPIIFVILLLLTGQIKNWQRFAKIIIGLTVILALAAIPNQEVIQQRLNSLYSRWEAAPPEEMITMQFQNSHNALKTVLIGQGLGRATNSARSLGTPDTVKLIETYYPKLIYEIGYPGMLAFLGFVTHLTYLSCKAYRSVRDRSLRGIGASFWVFILFISYNTYWYPLDTDPVAVYYWLFAGVIFKLPEIEKQEKAKLKIAND